MYYPNQGLQGWGAPAWGNYGEQFAPNAFEEDGVHDESMDDEGIEEDQPDAGSDSFYAEQLSMDEYQKQTKNFTKNEVDHLVRSPEYQKKINTCSSCWCNWLEGQFNEVCMECGGHPLSRPCPVCEGRCGAVWRRDIEMSHSTNEAHWNGTCALPEDQQRLFMLKLFQDETSEDSVTQAMEDLAT